MVVPAPEKSVDQCGSQREIVSESLKISRRYRREWKSVFHVLKPGTTLPVCEYMVHHETDGTLTVRVIPLTMIGLAYFRTRKPL